MITLTIVNGPTFEVPYTTNMNVQQVMEAAYNSAAPGTFTYSLQYYGSSLGYLVAMINETYESFNSKDEPFFFWELLINGSPASKGIDFTIVKDNDNVSFSFITYTASIAQESTVHAKYLAKH